MNILFQVTITIREENNGSAEFLGPELNWDTHCGDQPTFGRFSTMFDYPTKAITQASSYPPEACQPWLHYNMRLGNLAVDTNIQFWWCCNCSKISRSY